MMFRTHEREILPKDLTKTELMDFGIPINNFETVSTLEDLKKTPPNIIVAYCKTPVEFIQNYFEKQTLKKKVKYVMGITTYLQIHYDTRHQYHKKSDAKILKPAPIQFKKIYRHYNGQDLSDKTLLIFRSGGIGDLLFIQPNLIYLKEKYPTCTIKLACSPQYQSMVYEWDCVDEILDLPFTDNHLLLSEYHCVFEGVIERCKESETINAYNLFTNWMGLNLPDNLLVPKQKPNEESIEECKKILRELNIEEKNFIIVQMRSSSPIRNPRPTIWKKLIDILTLKGYNILLTDSPHKTSDIDKFISTLDNKEKVKNFCQYSETISKTIAITSLAKLAISVDSSLIHIAESLGIKSFGIFGSFLGRTRLSTYKNSDWIDVQKKECAPCFKHSKMLCGNSSFGYVNCFDNLNYDECIEKIERLYNS